MNKKEVLEQIKGGLIVSCQAEKNEPLGKPEILAALAQTAVIGGAVGIRACYPENIKTIKDNVDVPVIGIYKKEYSDSDVFISPTWKENQAVIEVNPEIIALDATDRKRPDNESLKKIVDKIRQNSDSLLMADIDNLENAIKAIKLGFDMIGTTLSGYTRATESDSIPYKPDFQLIKDLIKTVDGNIPIIAEGRIWEPEDARQIMELGVHAVVIGSAITRPHHITRRFVEAIKQ